MRILHTADLHLGQILYNYYDRVDEHDHFFKQLTRWCRQYQPDALLVSGDLFDIPQPSAATKEHFNQTFAFIHRTFPDMAIVATAGNHDSASRIEADSTVWELSGVTLVGHGPSETMRQQTDWEDRYIVETPKGFIIAMPFMANHRTEFPQALLDRTAARNSKGLPVVMMGHLAVAGGDFLGHSDIGTLRTQPVENLGNGFDYMALGHIHRPQTIGWPLDDERQPESTYPAGVVRYSGSALHVSCDERYPHSVSMVDIDRHGGTVHLRRLRIDELRHFYILPSEDKAPAASAEEMFGMVDNFCATHKSGYIRLRMDHTAATPSDFVQSIYRKLEATGNGVRFNTRTIWEGAVEETSENEKTVFEVVELQQMTNPLTFIEKTIGQFPTLNMEQLRADFELVKEELKTLEEQ